ncbi:hypothetical protein ZIOFF_063967 [Zingiber officinale]|uniref:Glycosyltransferase family 92 protein n=1 Tax=Zingiber officinale TaxID=94328 RepID=A0A8J5F6X5_ZINOF|nr:hypothetical protein ZIOFF_063967 [Zingiber officinale]
MPGITAPLRGPSSGGGASSSVSFASRVILLLTVLPLALAFFAFVLQWRGGLNDPASAWPSDTQKFPGMENSPLGSSSSSVSSSFSSSSSSDCAEILSRSSSPSFPYYHGWKFDFDSDPRSKVGICSIAVLVRTLVCDGILIPAFEWEAAKPAVSAVLESIPVFSFLLFAETVSLCRELKSFTGQENSKRNKLKGFFYKPCNYELFVKQSLNMEMAIVMARDAGVDWIIHVDTDELIYPAGAREYSLRQLLSDVSSNVDMVIFPNYESSIERDDIKDPFTEVSMFKKNYDHLPKDTYFGLYKEATRGNPNYFLTYGNGKSAARVRDFLRPNGAHRWHNYMKTPNEIKLEEAAILHYTYAKFSDLTSRRDRCSCKPTKDDVKRCFILDFDRDVSVSISLLLSSLFFKCK